MGGGGEPGDLKAELLEALRQADLPHVQRMTFCAAVLATALSRVGMEATLVGGAAIEFYAPGSYITHDLDFVVERGTREAMGEVFEALGLEKRGRHWVLEDLYVEVPGNWMSEPTEEFDVGPYTLRIVKKEYVLGDRVVGFRHWKTWAYGLQAIDLIRAFGAEIDEPELRRYLKSEGAEDAFDLLRDLAQRDEPVEAGLLDRLWHQRYR